MSDSSTIKRYCPECRKPISHFADKCPYCTADVSSTSENANIVTGVTGLIGLFSSWKNFSTYFLIPFLYFLIIIGLSILIFGKENGLSIGIVLAFVFGGYKAYQYIQKI